MNKKALVVTINSELCKWLYSKLKEENCNEGQDLIEGLEELINNDVGSVILDINRTDEVNVKRGLNIEGLNIDIDKRTVIYKNKTINLTPKEFDILYLLASNRGKIYSKDQIYTHVWKEQYSFDDSNIMAHIRRLRKKLEVNPESPQLILTVWGIGYKFNDKMSK